MADSRTFIQGLKTFLWVAPLTVLIWIYAEREMLAIELGVQAQVQVQLSNPAERILIGVVEQPSISLDLKGPRASLDAVRDQLFSGRKLELLVTEDAEFDGTISVADRIGRNELLTKNAVSVIAARPPSLHVRVESKFLVPVPITIRPTQQPVGTVVFDPEKVTVTGPRSVLSDPNVRSRLVVYADMAKFVGKAPGHYDETVKLDLKEPIENVALESKTSHATVVIRTAAEGTKFTFPVKVAIPALTIKQDKYRIDPKEVTLPNVEVSGPAASIQLMNDSKFSFLVIADLPPDKIAGRGERTISIPLKAENYRVPADVTVTNPDREITVTISDRGN
jgi:hypothetical protein